jgi:hypothetical protein
MAVRRSSSLPGRGGEALERASLRGSSPDQRPRRQHGLHHEAAGAGVQDADGAQGEQRQPLHGIAHPGGIVEIVGRERPDQGLMQGARSELAAGRDDRGFSWPTEVDPARWNRWQAFFVSCFALPEKV